jgi:hypothetical protein
VKLLSTEIDEEAVQLTYTDGPGVPEAKQVLIARWPLQDTLQNSVLWHQMSVLFKIAEWASEEGRRIRNELEKG